MNYYHFTSDKLRDGRPIPPNGEWLEHEGLIIPCESGLHASEHPFDALKYAPGCMLHLVELGGEILSHDDKVVAQRRRIIKTIDATVLLRRFACDQALSVAHLWDMPDIVREYLETMDESKRYAAQAAAWEVAGEYAQESAWASAWASAWEATQDAAWAPAQDAAQRAAGDAVRAAAWEVAGEYAQESAWASAWASAWEATRAEFKRRVDEALLNA